MICGGRKKPRCVSCGRKSEYQCDWKVAGGTCDKHICWKHVEQVGEDKHLCPGHQQAYKKWLAQQSEQTA